MRNLARLVLLAAMLVPIASATDLRFDTPAQWNGLSAMDAQWFVATFEGPTTGAITLSTGHGEATNHTIRFVGVDALGEVQTGGTAPPESNAAGTGSINATLSFPHPGRASLLIVADAIHIQTGSQTGEAATMTSTRAAEAVHETYRDNMIIRAQHEWQGHAVIRSAEPGPISVTVQGLRNAEWLNASLSCTGWCPSGGGLWGASPSAVGSRVAAYTAAFLEFETTHGLINGTMSPRAWALGGSQVDMHVKGWVRLPNAQSLCGCQEFDGSTLQVNGSVVLANLTGEEAVLAADLLGNITWARSDERVLYASNNMYRTDIAALAAVGTVLPFLVWLALRIASENRTRVLRQIQEEPGITFRSLMRQLGLSNGTVAHHLEKLSKARLVVRTELGSTHHYFENHNKYGEADRLARAHLQDPALQVLAAVIQRHGPMRQRDILHHTKTTLGWNPSTTQRRLQRLENAGLVSTSWDGGRWYFAKDPEAKPAPKGHEASMVARRDDIALEMVPPRA